MGGHPNLRMWFFLSVQPLNIFRVIGLYLDGGFVEGMQLPYPRPDSPLGTTSSVQYKLGNDTSGPNRADDSSWCLASAYLLGFPLRMCAPINILLIR